MEGILVKMQSAKDGFVQLTIKISKDKVTVDFMDYVDKPINVTIPDEKE